MNLLVTGGAGFIGSGLCRRLAGEWRITVVDKLTYAGHLSSLAAIMDRPNFRFIEADVCDRAAMDVVFAQCAPDAVAHLAAESHVDRSIAAPPEFVRTNIVGTSVMLEAALAYWRKLAGRAQERFRFLHVSTDEVFGSLGPDGAFDEKSPRAPRSPYAASKASSDHLAAAWRHTYGLPVVISNCSNNYGPYQLPEKLVPLMILRGLNAMTLPVYGDGLQVRDWLHVDDHVRALASMLEESAPGESYVVGGGCEKTNLAVVEAICDLLDRLAPGAAPRRSSIRFVADRPGHDRRYAIDAGKIAAELGWSPRIAFAEGLAATVEWYLANRRWWEPLWAEGHGRIRHGRDDAG